MVVECYLGFRMGRKEEGGGRREKGRALSCGLEVWA